MSKTITTKNDLTLHELTMRNFMSYGDNVTTLNLNRNEPTLIIGENMDMSEDGQIDSNGAGKTTCLNAIIYAFYGKVDKMSVNDLINDFNRKNLEVTLTFETGGKFYKIIRFRKNKLRGGSGCILLINDSLDFDEERDGQETPANTVDAKIKEIITMPFEVCTRILAFSASTDSFMELPLDKQRLIIEELFSMKVLSEKAKVLREKMKQTKSDFENLLLFEERLTAEKERFQQQLESAQYRFNEWDTNKANQIKKLNEDISALSSIDYDNQELLLKDWKQSASNMHEMQTSIATLKNQRDSHLNDVKRFNDWEVENTKKLEESQSKIDKLSGIDFQTQTQLFELLATVSTKITNINNDVNVISGSIQANLSEKNKISTEIASLQQNVCPYCNQDYQEAKNKIVELNQRLSQIEENINESEVNLNGLNASLTTQQNFNADINEQLLYSNVDEMNTDLQALNTAQEMFNQLSQVKNPYSFDETVSVDDINNNITSIEHDLANETESWTALDGQLVFKDESVLYESKSSIDVLKNELKNVEESENPHVESVESLKSIELDKSKSDEIDALKSEMEHENFMLKLLTKKDSFIRKALLNKSIPFLNSRLQYYLQLLGMPHRVEFQSDMTAKVSMFDCVKAYSGLSAGQKARIKLSLSFAFRDVLQASHGKINFCMLDEFLDSHLSDVGISRAVKMLREVAKEDNLSMFIVSHRNEITSMFDKSIKVVLEKGFSRLED